MKYQVLSSIVAGAMTLAFSTGTHDYKWPYHPRPHKDYTVPTVFQAAGPDIASIQGTVDQFRAALGGVNNGNVAGPLDAGRREINWDGGGSTATSPAPTPFSDSSSRAAHSSRRRALASSRRRSTASSRPSTILTTRTSFNRSARCACSCP